MRAVDPAIFLSVLVTSAGVSVGAGPNGVDLAALAGWDIVVAEDAIESEVYAAEEFQRLYKRAGEAELPIVREIARPNRHVFVGPGGEMRGSAVGFDVDSFGQEDLRIVVRDENIAIAGGRPRGTLYGVYSFLEDYLGVRFLTADHTHVPPLTHGRKIGPVDRFYHPPMDFRWVSYEANFGRPEFATRLRLNAARLPASPVAGKDWSNAGKYGGRTSMRHINHAFDDQSCHQNVWFNKQLRQWGKLTGNLYTWNYYLNGENHSFQLPLPNLRLIGRNIRYQRSLGVKGMYLQATSSCHGNEWEDLRNYMLSNLLWDPTRDEDRLMQEWLDLHYGPAAPPIARWIARLHDRVAASGKHCRCLGGKLWRSMRSVFGSYSDRRTHRRVALDVRPY